MSEASRGMDTSAEQNKIGPDYFAYYTREVTELFSQDENFLPFSSQTSGLAGRTHEIVRDNDITKHNYKGKEGNSFIGSGSLFCDAVGAGLSDFKKERLKSLLRQSVVALTGEVDEMLDPVVAMHHLRSCLRYKKSLSSYVGGTCESDVGQHPQKKLKQSSSSSSISIPLHTSPASCSLSGEGSANEDMDAAVPGNRISTGVKKQCTNCHTVETLNWRTGPDGPKSLCHDCGIKFKQGKESLLIKDHNRESFLGSDIGAENGEVNDDLQFLLENDGSKVDETMKKYSDELSATLGLMEQKLEELLDTVMSSCRSMTRAEKQKLRLLIQKLPPRNLDRVVEIIQSREPSAKYSCDEIRVDLEDKDNVTLWRLYYYVETVENARKLTVT